MTARQVEVVLTAAALDLDDLAAGAAAGRAEIDAVTGDVDDADRRLDRIIAELPVGVPTDDLSIVEPAPVPTRPTPLPVSGKGPVWDDRVARARDRIVALGMDPEAIDIDRLLTPEERRRIERRHRASFEVKAQLDAYDVLAAVAAGAAATAVDALLVRVPRDMRWQGATQKGSPLTKAMRDLSLGPDNWLARMAKVPFDQVKHTGIDGMGPLTHRVHTMGHDPLIGLVMGTIDIMRGTLTGVAKSGEVAVTQTDVGPVSNPFAALAIEILHLLSDVPTRMGLPLPGWSILMTMPIGSIGPDGQTVNELASQMYLRGYNTTHLLTMATVPATVELILDGYWELRRRHDADFAAEIQATSHAERGDDPRYQAMLLLGHGVAVAGNLAKVAGRGGNPLALNYAEWMRFTQKFFVWAQTRLAAPTDTLLAQMAKNQAVLDAGWVSLGLDDPAFVSLAESTWPEAADDLPVDTDDAL